MCLFVCVFVWLCVSVWLRVLVPENKCPYRYTLIRYYPITFSTDHLLMVQPTEEIKEPVTYMTSQLLIAAQTGQTAQVV